MANFDEDHKLIWTEITDQEAQLYINFLRRQIGRHEREEELSRLLMSVMDKFSAELEGSSVFRHAEDIEGALIAISKVKEYFRL